VSKTIDFYFDFISPFSYLAEPRLTQIAKNNGYELAYHPMEIPQAKLYAGNYGPSNREVPAKMKVLGADIQRWAKHYGMPFKFPSSLTNGRQWNIAALYAIDHGAAEAFVHDAYTRLWGQGADPNDEKELRAAAKAAGLDDNALIEYSNSVEGKSAFGKACMQAFQRGVFGAPIMMVDDQVFWGNDRLDFLEAYLKDPASMKV